MEVQELSSPSPGTINFTAVSFLGFIKERVACSAGNVTILGLDKKLPGFMLLKLFLPFSWFSVVF